MKALKNKGTENNTGSCQVSLCLLSDSRGRSLDLANPDILVFNPHRCTGVQLQGQDPFFQSQFWMIVCEIQDQLAIHVMLDVVALADDDDIVPFIQFEELFPASLIDQV